MVSTDPAVRAVAALDDEQRARIYAFVRAEHRPVTREQAGAAVGISRKLAAFHLDKLVATGLLRVRDQDAADQPRVGRRPKVYEPTDVEVRINIPARQHDLLATILLDAVLAEPGPGGSVEAATRVAHRRGVELGAAVRAERRPGRLGAERALHLAAQLLARYGYEPVRPTPSSLRLRNCPFHPLTDRAPELVCAINHAFIAGILAGVEADSLTATLTPPADGGCCVGLSPRR